MDKGYLMPVPGTLDLNWEDFISTVKKDHQMWKETKEFRSKFNIVGKNHFTFKTPKGEVSMIRYNNLGHRDGTYSWCWEIYSDNLLFDDVERFNTWKEVRERIKQVLSPNLEW